MEISVYKLFKFEFNFGGRNNFLRNNFRHTETSRALICRSFAHYLVDRFYHCELLDSQFYHEPRRSPVEICRAVPRPTRNMRHETKVPFTRARHVVNYYFSTDRKFLIVGVSQPLLECRQFRYLTWQRKMQNSIFLSIFVAFFRCTFAFVKIKNPFLSFFFYSNH